MGYDIDFNKIKFYKYNFYGIQKPIIIEARSRDEARKTIQGLVPILPKIYAESKIIGETISTPLLGISEKKIDGKKHIWVGESRSKNGWMEEQKYLETIKKYNNGKKTKD